VACTRGVTTGATGEAEAHADVGEAVEGEEAATTTMRELDQEEADRIRQHNESTNEYNSVLLRVRRPIRSLTAALHVRHAIIDVSLSRAT
jgi:hypothetical protein